MNELEHVPEKNEKEIKELTVREEKLCKDLEKEKAAMEKAMAGLKAETQELQDSKDQLQNQLMGLKKTEDETKSAVSIIFVGYITFNHLTRSLGSVSASLKNIFLKDSFQDEIL